jgi:flavin reductase (DIM6/NTAB) family NADH-FMN oxidoreductase RutF
MAQDPSEPSTSQPLATVPVSGFREFMARFPSGVAVVTTVDTDGTPRGMTCSSVCSVTPLPPTLLVCLRHGSPTLASVLQRTRFTVNILHAEGQRVAELFASGDPDRFDQIRWHLAENAGGPHLTDYAHAIADCRVASTEHVGDHVVVFGEIYRIRTHDERPALLYGRRRYGAWPWDEAADHHAVAPRPANAMAFG